MSNEGAYYTLGEQISDRYQTDVNLSESQMKCKCYYDRSVGYAAEILG